MCFIRIAAYHVQQCRLGLLGSDDAVTCGNVEKNDDGTKLTLEAKSNEDAIVNQIKVRLRNFIRKGII